MIDSRIQITAVNGANAGELINIIHLYLDNITKLGGVLESKDITQARDGLFTCFLWYYLPVGKKMPEIGFKVK